MLRFWGRLFCRLIGGCLVIPALVLLVAVLRVPRGIPAYVLALALFIAAATLTLGGMIIRLAPKKLPRDPDAPPSTGGHGHN